AVAVGELDGEVGPAFFLQFLLTPVRRDALHQGRGVVVVERLGVEPAQAAVVPDDRRLADGDVQVACFELNHRGRQFVDEDRTSNRHVYSGETMAGARSPEFHPESSQTPRGSRILNSRTNCYFDQSES